MCIYVYLMIGSTKFELTYLLFSLHLFTYLVIISTLDIFSKSSIVDEKKKTLKTSIKKTLKSAK